MNEEDSNHRNHRQQQRAPPEITRSKQKEIWWDKVISILLKVTHNIPDIVLWELDTKQCKILDICVPLDISLELRDTTKRDKYIPLISQLQRMFPGYTYTIIPVITGALGTVPRKLSENLKKLGLPPKRVTLTINRIQKNGNTW